MKAFPWTLQPLKLYAKTCVSLEHLKKKRELFLYLKTLHEDEKQTGRVNVFIFDHG